MKFLYRSKNKSGFTLVELMVAICVFAILMLAIAAVLVPSLRMFLGAIQWTSDKNASNTIFRYLDEELKYARDVMYYQGYTDEEVSSDVESYLSTHASDKGNYYIIKIDNEGPLKGRIYKADLSSKEELIGTLTYDGAGGWGRHEIGDLDFTNYKNVRFVVTHSDMPPSGNPNEGGNWGLNRMYITVSGSSEVDCYFAGTNKLSLSGTLDGTTNAPGSSTIFFPNVAGKSAHFAYEGNPGITIKMYGEKNDGSGGGIVYKAIYPEDYYGARNFNYAISVNSDGTLSLNLLIDHNGSTNSTHKSENAFKLLNYESSAIPESKGGENLYLFFRIPEYDFSTATDTGTSTPGLIITTDADTNTDTNTSLVDSDTPSDETISTLNCNESGWSKHTIGTVDFSNYKDISFEMTCTDTQYGFNKFFINGTEYWLNGNRSSLSGTLDGNDSSFHFANVAGQSGVTFAYEGNPIVTIKFRGTKTGSLIDTDTSTESENPQTEQLITTMTGNESGWSKHTLGSYNFTNYTNIRFEMTSTDTQYGFNKFYINGTEYWLGGNMSSLSGTLDGNDSSFHFSNVAGQSNVSFAYEGNPGLTIRFYGMGPGGGGSSGGSGVTNYTITTAVTPANSGTVTGSGTYAANSTATLTATPATGYKFVKWNEDNNTNKAREITVTGNATYTAVFEALPKYTVTTSVGGGSGTITATSSNYTHGTKVTIAATPASGWQVQKWVVDGADVVSSSTTYNFNSITANHTVQVVFEAIPAPSVLNALTSDGKIDYSKYTSLSRADSNPSSHLQFSDGSNWGTGLYYVVIDTEGDYTLTVNYKGNGDALFQVAVDDNIQFGYNQGSTWPNANWNNVNTKTTTIHLTAGNHTIEYGGMKYAQFQETTLREAVIVNALNSDNTIDFSKYSEIKYADSNPSSYVQFSDGSNWGSAKYYITIATEGDYTLTVKYKGNGDALFQVAVDDNIQFGYNKGSTWPNANWNNENTMTSTVHLTAGNHTIEFGGMKYAQLRQTKFTKK